MKSFFSFVIFLFFLLKSCELTPIRYEDLDKDLLKTNLDKSEEIYTKRKKTKAIGYVENNKFIS